MRHPSLNLEINYPPEAYRYGKRASGETHGVVLTKPHIVDMILDLAGYSEDQDLSMKRMLEPSCGTGVFLVAAARRLIRSARQHNRRASQLKACLLAYDIDPRHVKTTRTAVEAVLIEEGVKNRVAKSLAEEWVRQNDFLLAPLEGQTFDTIVGNPPYIRIEQLSPDLQNEYRSRYETLYDRADIYVAFIERSLSLLPEKGTLSFICADRWTLNRYGAPLRRIIAENYQIKTYVDLHKTSPFESEVIAYPSIFAISPGKTGRVSVGRLSEATPEECGDLTMRLRNPGRSNNGAVSVYPSWFVEDEPWVLSSPAHLKALRDLESRFDTIEADQKTSVRIGVATGNDSAYIVGPDSGIEKNRLVPLVMRADLEKGQIKNNSRFVINTFDTKGKIIDLSGFPRLRQYLEEHGIAIRRRHVAKKNPGSWFRTIDRVYPELVPAQKLLIPDIAGSNEITLDTGKYHPHHNLYYVTSKSWDMAVLGGLLSSKVALFFIWSYATKMRGGYLRFQAQYLRRIRIPKPSDIPKQLCRDIREAFRQRDFKKLDQLALQAYGIKKLPNFDFVDTRK
ncbi:MAG: DNA methyltransferase [Elusimicrobia bacterium]|nr:MAG: DNA methyltransferase [Elusimicrobiota bacterium]